MMFDEVIIKSSKRVFYLSQCISSEATSNVKKNNILFFLQSSIAYFKYL